MDAIDDKMERDMITARLEIQPESSVSYISVATGYIFKYATDERYVDVLYDSFSEGISILRISGSNSKVLTSEGESKDINVQYVFEWEQDKEICIYGMRTNGDYRNMVSTMGYIRSVFKLLEESAHMQIGSLEFDICYEDHYGWHIDCETGKDIHIVDKFAPKNHILDTGGLTEVLRIGFSGDAKEITIDSGIGQYEVYNRFQNIF